MKISAKKYIKIGGIVAGSLLVFLVIVTLLINFLFKDQLIQIVINQLNKQVDARINIAKVDLSLWKRFPNISVQFDRVYAQSSNRFKTANNLTTPDTLLNADRIFFEFNLIKLIKGQYELKRVYIKNGYVKLKVDKNGILNYDIIKPSEKKSENQFNLELKDLEFTNAKIEYTNQSGLVKIFGMADKLRIKGDFASQKTNLNIYSKLFLNQLSVNNYSYISDKKLQFDVNLFIKDSQYQIRSTDFRIEELQFSTNGEFILGEHPFINLRVYGNKLNLNQLVVTLPDPVRNSLVGYNFKGKVNVDVLIHGLMGKSNDPEINMSYTLNNGSIVHQESGVKLRNLDLTGTYSFKNLDTSKISTINLDKVSLNLGSGKISGNGSIENINQPLVKLNASYTLNLNELKKFLNLDTLEVLSGNVEGKISASGVIRKKKSALRISDINDLSCVGQIRLQNAAIKLKGNDYFLDRINGNIDIDKNLNFNNITLFLHDNDFLINGSLLDWANYLGKGQKDVTLKADVTSRNLDLSKYFVRDTKKSATEYSRALLFPDHLNLEVKLNINKFKLNRFNAEWASGYLSYKPKIFVLKSLTFETLDGRVTGNGAVIQDMDKNFIVKGQVDVSKLDIKQMFYTFNNFSQHVLMDKHLQGRVSGKIGISSEWNNALYLNEEKLLVDADITIDNGELSNFEPMYSLSRFIALDELKNIKFYTLKNHIYIKDKQIVIPQMDVHSSAFDISASGVHLFDNHYSYKVKVLLSDILWGKAKRAKRENEEFGEVEDDGLGKTSIPLSITGFNKDYKITYDSRKAIDVVKQSLKNQKSEMKTILNEEFGWFKKDTTLKKNKLEKKYPKIRVDWDDANNPASDKKTNENTQKQNDKDKSPGVEWDN
jgi:hypothetical protein